MKSFEVYYQVQYKCKIAIDAPNGVIDRKGLTAAISDIEILEGGPRGPGRPWRPFCSGSHAEFGRDPRSSFPQNADLDPKIEECRLNPTRRDHSETLCPT